MTRTWLVGICAALLVTATVTALRSSDPAVPRSAASARDATVSIGGSPLGPAVAPATLGLSIEWDSVEAYTGGPGRRRAALARLLAGLGRAAGSPLALRIGGDSADQAWWNPARRPRPPTVLQDVTARTLGDVAWLARALHAPVTLGLNLALGDAGNALALARAARRRLPAGALEGLEIGNEPDLYTHPRTFRVPGHVHRRLRKSTRYDAARWAHETTRYLAVLRRGLGPRPRLVVAGFAGPTWWPMLDRALRDGLRRADALSGHLYALPSCSARTPTMTWLLSPSASRDRAAALAPLSVIARRHGLGLRVTELNSAACGGRAGLSERFGAALWLTDTLFALQNLGARQIDVHTWLHARYAPFVVHGDHAVARPEFLGMLAFARATPPGSHLTSAAITHPGGLRAWATVDRDGIERLALIAPEAVWATVESPPGGGCARVWVAVDGATATRPACPPYRLHLQARSLAVMTLPG